MNFFIDPYIFSLDKNNITKYQIELFIEKIIDWKKLIDCNWSNVYKLRETFDILFKNNLFPLVNDIKDIIAKHNIDYIQPEEVDKILNSLLNKLPTVEDYSKISDLLIDNDDFTFNDSRNDDFKNAFKKLTILAKLDCIQNKTNEDSSIIISTELMQSKIEYNVKLSIVESDNTFDLSKPFKINFHQYTTYKSFCLSTDPKVIWLNYIDNNCFKVSLYISLYQYDNQFEYFYFDKEPNFKFSESFYKSLKDLRFNDDETKANILIRAITEEILNINMKDTHELRETKGGNSKQLKDNNYSAWRRDLDYEYHLHYWKRGNELIFSDIVNHNNFKISSI